MLRELRIKNFAIIDDLSIRFEKGLNVLTGETGAGKSIIVDAINFVLGERASQDMIRHNASEVAVQSLFEIEGITLSVDTGIDIEDGLIVRRHFSGSGKGRAYINDTLVNLQTINSLGEQIVDIHGQHEHQSLMKREVQLRLIDLMGGHGELLSEYSLLYSEILSMKEELKRLTEDVRFIEQRRDMLRFQIDEIDRAKLKHGEEEELLAEYSLLTNITKLRDGVSLIYENLYKRESSCSEIISKSIQRLGELMKIDPSLSAVRETLEQCSPLIEDAVVNLRGILERYDIDPRRLDDVNERLDLIGRLKKKYGDSIKEILDYRERAYKELSELELRDERIESINNSLGAKEKRLLELAEEISMKRKEVGRFIEEFMKKELKELALEKAIFRISFQRKEEPGPFGIDDLQFEFSANPGEPPRPIIRVASGGELSRLMLALRVIMADVDKVPVLIFDEIDAGIGGVVGEKVAQKLKRLSKRHQIFCITHLPQIAAAADNHIKVEKIQKKDSVKVIIKNLTEEERVVEIARMLSGMVTDASLRHAKELLRSYI